MSELLSRVQEWVRMFGRDTGVDTSSWQLRATSETEFAVCGIPTAELAGQFADFVKRHCAAEVTVLDRHPQMPHWCVMSLATLVLPEDEVTSGSQSV